MRSKPVAFLLADLGVTKTHIRPHISDGSLTPRLLGHSTEDGQGPFPSSLAPNQALVSPVLPPAGVRAARPPGAEATRSLCLPAISGCCNAFATVWNDSGLNGYGAALSEGVSIGIMRVVFWLVTLCHLPASFIHI